MQLPARFATTRLMLRKPDPADAAPLFTSYLQDAEVSKYLVWRPYTELAAAEAFIARCLDNWDKGNEYAYVITDAASTTQLGMISVRPSGWSASLGYVLARAAWGKGVMPEAAGAVTTYILEQPDMFRVWAVCDVDNTASARVMEKIGMQREGLMRRGVLHPNMSSEPRDCWLYAKVT